MSQSGMQSLGRFSVSSVMIRFEMFVLITPAYVVLRVTRVGVWGVVLGSERESVRGAIGVPGLFTRFTDTLGNTSLGCFEDCVSSLCSLVMRVCILSSSCLLLGGEAGDRGSALSFLLGV